jgi:hypothetical protein
MRLRNTRWGADLCQKTETGASVAWFWAHWVKWQRGTLCRGGVVVHARWWWCWGCVFMQCKAQSGFGPKKTKTELPHQRNWNCWYMSRYAIQPYTALYSSIKGNAFCRCMAQFWAAMGLQEVERGAVGLQSPSHAKIERGDGGWGGMVSGGGCAYLLAWCPSCLSLSSLAAHWQAV